MNRNSKLLQGLLSVTLFLLASCSVQMDLNLANRPRGTQGGGSGGGGDKLDRDPQVQPATIGQVKILNQKQLLESLINNLGLTDRPAVLMTEFERVKNQLSINGTGGDYSPSLLLAISQLVARACNLVPQTAAGLPAVPPAGTQPSAQVVQQIADFYAMRLLNRQMAQNELSDLMPLVTEAYNSTSSDGAKFKLLSDIICTVIGTSVEAQVL